MKIGIIGAMQVEVDSLTAAMQGAVKADIGGVTFYEGTLCGVPVVAARSGVGKVNAALCAHTMALKFGVTHVINTGIAGNMRSGNGVGDFVVSTDAMYYDIDAHGFGYPAGVIPQMECSDFVADAALIGAVESAYLSLYLGDDIFKDLIAHKGRLPKIWRGRVASGDKFVSERALKEQIKALCDPDCVEMEGAAIAHACYLNKVPFVIVRCLSDDADDGEEATYSINEKACAMLNAQLVENTLRVIDERWR